MPLAGWRARGTGPGLLVHAEVGDDPRRWDISWFTSSQSICYEDSLRSTALRNATAPSEHERT